MNENFRAVEWMREKRSLTDEEDRDLTWREKTRRTEKLLEKDPLWQRLKTRVIAPTPAALAPKKV